MKHPLQGLKIQYFNRILFLFLSLRIAACLSIKNDPVQVGVAPGSIWLERAFFLRTVLAGDLMFFIGFLSRLTVVTRVPSFFQEYISDVFIYSPILSLFLLPVSRARHLPVASDKTVEEEYRVQGRALYQLAQDFNTANTSSHGNHSVRVMRIRNVTQATLVGLLATQTLPSPTLHSERSGPIARPALEAQPDSTIPFNSPRDRFTSADADADQYPAKENDDEVSFNLMYLPDSQYPNYKGTRFFAVPIYKNRPPKPSLVPSTQSSLMSSANPGQLDTSDIVRPVSETPVVAPSAIPPDDHGVKTSAGSGTRDTFISEQYPPRRPDVSPTRRFSGHVVALEETQLSAMPEQVATKSRRRPSNVLSGEPDGLVPEPPVLSDF
ncbi:hypothetical protein, partial [Martelella alba]|uniref:hypothetical protein n=1 Tax=Martelella alba TaxID=2590451 RepID=UPI0014851C02